MVLWEEKEDCDSKIPNHLVLLEEMPGPKTPVYPTDLFMYEECPRQFLWKRGWEGIDCGNGPGRRKESPKTKEQSAALMGTVIQSVAEDFYNQEMWRNLSTLEKDLKEKCRVCLDENLEKGRFVLNGLSPSRGEMLSVITSGIMNFLKTVKAYKLLSNRSRSEEKLIVHKDGISLGSKIDFIIEKKDSVLILDGKNSKHKMKYLKPDQLRFYALVYEEKYGKRPDRLGFIWYRFPYDELTGEEGVDWISFTDRDLQGLEERVREAHKGMVEEKFHATPNPKVCTWCDYETVCPERMEQKERNSKKRGSKSLAIVPTGIFSMGEVSKSTHGSEK